MVRRPGSARILLILLLSGITGLGAALGSIVGNAAGPRGLQTGAILGGLLALRGALWLARRFGLLEPGTARGAFVGGALGFFAAALLALRTASSPVGPVLSTLLIGVGGLLGSRFGATRG